jgi:hypothetical protein
MAEVEAIKAAYANHDNAEIVVYPDAAHNSVSITKHAQGLSRTGYSLMQTSVTIDF